MRRSLLPLALCALLPLQVHAGTPLEDALAAPTDGPLYMFDIIIQNTDTDAMVRVDPSRPQGERLSVISPAREDWTDDFRKLVKEMDADTDGDIWCHGFGENIPASAALVSETATKATYTFKPQPGSVEMVSEKAFRPLPIAKIKDFKLKFDCSRAPDGRTHVSRVNIDISGSAMMQGFSETERQTITNLKPLPQSGMGTK